MNAKPTRYTFVYEDAEAHLDEHFVLARDYEALEREVKQLREVERAARASYDRMARHYGDEPEEWWPQLHDALAAVSVPGTDA